MDYLLEEICFLSCLVLIQTQDHDPGYASFYPCPPLITLAAVQTTYNHEIQQQNPKHGPWEPAGFRQKLSPPGLILRCAFTFRSDGFSAWWNSQELGRTSEIPPPTSATVILGNRLWLDIPLLLFLCSALQRENKDITDSVYSSEPSRFLSDSIFCIFLVKSTQSTAYVRRLSRSHVGTERRIVACGVSKTSPSMLATSLEEQVLGSNWLNILKCAVKKKSQPPPAVGKTNVPPIQCYSYPSQTVKIIDSQSFFSLSWRRLDFDLTPHLNDTVDLFLSKRCWVIPFSTANL